MKTFKDYYQFPLRYDGLIYVRTNNYQIAFHWLYLRPEDLKYQIVDALNSNTSINHPCYFNDDYIISKETNKPILRIRGWGMLTDNPYHLSSEEAIRIQNEFADYIVKLLND